MAAHHIRHGLGRTLVIGLVLALVPSVAYAQDEAPLDTGWDIVSVDLGAALDDPDATGAVTTRTILQAVGAQGDPERSPDGTRLAYVSVDGASGDWPRVQVYVLEPDGTQRRVTDHDAGADQPTWSPDGERIAFVGLAGGIFSDTPLRDDQRTLVEFDDATAPDWSPDGRHVVFQRGEEDGGEIWNVNVRTGKLKQLTRSERSPKRCKGPGKPVGEITDPYEVWAHLPVCEFRSRDPVYSPDGRWIAFMRHEDMPSGNLEFEDTDIWLMRADGSDQHRAVTGEDEPIAMPGFNSPDGHFQGAPTWSPDGRYLAITGGHCGCLLVVDVATGTPRQLGFPGLARMGGDLVWSGDGTLLGESADPSSSVWDVE